MAESLRKPSGVKIGAALLRKLAATVLLVGIFLGLSQAAALDPSMWNGGFLGGRTDHFLDLSGALTLDDVVGPDSGRFIPANGRPANHGVAAQPGAALWLRLVTPPLAGPPEQNWALYLNEPRARNARLYVVGAQGSTGDAEWRFDNPRGSHTRFPVFIFPARALEGKTLYLRIASLSSLRATLYLDPIGSYEAGSSREAVLLGALVGALIAGSVYSLTLGLAVGEAPLVALSAFAMSFAIFLLADRGFVETVIFEGATTLSRALSFGLTFLIYLTAIVFSASYLKVPLQSRIGRAAIAALVAIYASAVVVAVADVLGNHLRLRQVSAPLGLAAILAMILMGLVSARVDRGRAALYLLCWLPAISSGFARVALDAFPDRFAAFQFSVYGLYPGIAASMIAFAIVSSIEAKHRLAFAQLALAASEQRSYDYSRATSDDFWECDRSGAITRLLLSEPPVLPLKVGQNIVDAFRAAGEGPNAQSFAELSRALASRLPFRTLPFEFGAGTADERHVLISAQPVRSELDPIAAWRGALTDVTAQTLRERDLQRERRMIELGVLVGSIAHEINNLLHPIVNLSRLAMERAATDTEMRRMLKIVSGSGKQAAEIVANVLRISRKRDPGAAVPFGQALTEALETLENFGSANIGLDTRIATPDGPAAEPTQVFQIVTNLVANAARAMNYTGSISIVYEEVEGTDRQRCFRFVVSDSGMGMDEEIRRRAFEPLFSTAGAAGTGFGLSVVRSIVESLGGQVGIDSTPGAGARVIVDLAMARDAERASV